MEKILLSKHAQGEWRGARLNQLLMYENAEEKLYLYVWNEHLMEKKVVELMEEITLSHDYVKITNIVVTFNSVRHCLIANTTASTKFIKQKSCSDEYKMHDVSMHLTQRPEFESLFEISKGELNCDVILRKMKIEKVYVNALLSSNQEWNIALLTECYCTICECALPELEANVIPRLYGVCLNRCYDDVKFNQGKEKAWRYRDINMVIVDSMGDKLDLLVHDSSIQELMANITAEMVVCPSKASDNMVFNVRDTVSNLLSSLASGSKEYVDMEVHCSYIGESAQLIEGHSSFFLKHILSQC